jgi:CHAT domain-containing protein/tetratricopeptide (TPR) repeat protein
MAVVQNNLGDKKKAIEYLDQALPLMRAAGDRSGEAATLNQLGRAHSQTGEGRKALTYFEAARQIFTELQDRSNLATLTSNIGTTYDNLGEFQRAIENHQQSLALRREIANPIGEATSLNNLGSAYSGLGEYQKALDAYTAAMEINRKWDSRGRLLAVNLHNIAWIYDNLGDRRRALEYYQQAVEIFRAQDDKWALGNSLNNLAKVHADLGDFANALKLHTEAFSLRKAVSDAVGEGTSLANIGNTYLKLGERTKALDHFERALSIHRNSGELSLLSATLRNLGTFYREGKDYQRASGYLDEALQVSRTIRERRGEAAALAGLARLESERGNLVKAHERAREALAAFESLRLAVGSPSLRASFFASAREAQELDIEALMRLHVERPGEGFGAAALLVSERGRARSLLELLVESAAEIRRGVDTALLDRERELNRLISAKAELRARLLNRKYTDGEAATAKKELDALTVEYEQIQGRIRETSPQYAALTRPVPLNLEEIQTKVLDSDTILLEYALGKDRSFLWVVTFSSMDVFELPPRAEIESAARRVYELLTARNQKLAKETPAARVSRVRDADEAFFAAASKAGRMLLAPAAARLEKKRLLIVAEGVLQYLPFAALPEPASGAAGAAKPPPLMVNHEIVTAPSASVIQVLRQETAGRKPAEKSVAVLADPVFSTGDLRIAQQKIEAMTAAGKNSARGEAQRSAADLGVQEFVRLRFSRAEAEEIVRLAPPGTVLRALDFDASRERALKQDLAQYRIVHFATHSLLNNEHPELSGVVLSLVDRNGLPQNGFLRLYDIYNLRLGADLVVLSACQTALGGEIKGEGLIGLTRGFLYAGAPRLVATLWEIDDRTTSQLMKRFYEGMLTRGERVATALKAAQVAMWKTKGWDSPYYWAAFTVQGEWR